MSLLTPGDNRLMHNQYPVSKFVRFLGLIIVVTSTFATAQSRPQLTMEWALGEAGSNIARVMRAVWLDDNTAVLYNDQLPQSERTFERLDPASGKRQPLVDASKALASLKSLHLPARSAHFHLHAHHLYVRRRKRRAFLSRRHQACLRPR
jgi:hypothetical protein